MRGRWKLAYYADQRGQRRVAVVSSTGAVIADFQACDFQRAWNLCAQNERGRELNIPARIGWYARGKMKHGRKLNIRLCSVNKRGEL